MAPVAPPRLEHGRPQGGPHVGSQLPEERPNVSGGGEEYLMSRNWTVRDAEKHWKDILKADVATLGGHQARQSRRHHRRR